MFPEIDIYQINRKEGIKVFCHAALEDWRKKQNITKSQMAKLLNLSNGYYGYLERGIRQPSTKVITKLLELTNLSSEEFFPINKTSMKVNPLELRTRFLKAQRDNLNLQKVILAREIEIANDKSIIYILEEIMNAAINSIRKRHSIDKYKNEIINIAKKAIQMDIPCDIVCRAFGINIFTLKTWIGQEKLLFKCRFDLFEPITTFTPERAGEEFRCIDCIHLQSGNCKGFGISIQHSISNSDKDIDIFNIIENLKKKGITERRDQLLILEKRYNFKTTEATLNEYIRRHNKGQYVPDSFRYMIEELC
jgi:transcriptional regulator with XRE-family HTH domain